MLHAMPNDVAAFRDLLDALTDLRRFWERPDRKRWFQAELGVPVELALLRTLAAVARCCASSPAAPAGTDAAAPTDVTPGSGSGDAPAADGAVATVGAVADALAVSQSTASRLVDQAVRAGYLDRHADALDRRRAGLELTDAGRSLLARADEIRHRWLAEVTAGWEPADVHRLAGLLRRFLDAATEAEERWR
jgi:DNA-binding MarR family transcriptional regulator